MHCPNLSPIPFMLLVILAMTSCNSAIYYAPNAQNVPLHKKKEEVKLRGTLGTGVSAQSLDLQGSYSFHDHFALMANFQRATWGSSVRDRPEFGVMRVVEVGVGYYNAITNKIVFESYVGGGGGTVTNDYERGSSRLGMQKIFWQPQIGFTSRSFDFALGMRMNWLNFNRAETIGSVPQEEIIELFDIRDRGTYVLVEPALTFRFGQDPVKAQIQLVPLSNLTDWNLQQDEFQISAGLQIQF